MPDDLDLARPGGVVLAGVVLHGDGDLGDDRADEFLALGVGGGRGLEDGPQVGSGGGDPGGFLLGEGDGPAGLLGGELVFRGAHGRELVFQDGLQGPGDQPVLRLDVVVLAQRPAGFETGPFQRAFEHGQVLAEPGFGVGHGLDGGGQAGGGERGQQLGQHRLVQPPAADPLAGRRAVHLVGASAPVGGAAAGVVVDLHEPSAPAAAQPALQPGCALPRGAAGPAGRRRGVGGQPGDVGVVGFQGDVAGMVTRDHHGPLVTREPPLPGDHGPAGSYVLFGLAAAVGEHPGIAGMDQDAVHGRVAGLRPCDLPGADVSPGQPQAVSAEADDHLPGRAELPETAEHARDRLAYRLIR